MVFSGRIKRLGSSEPSDEVPDGQEERQPMSRHPEDEVPDGFELKTPAARYQVGQRVIAPKHTHGDDIVRITARGYDKVQRSWSYELHSHEYHDSRAIAVPEDDILPVPPHDEIPPAFQVGEKVKSIRGGAFAVVRVFKANRDHNIEHRYELRQYDPKYVFDVLVPPERSMYPSNPVNYAIKQSGIEPWAADEKPRLPAVIEAPGRCVKCGRGTDRYPAFNPVYRRLENASLWADNLPLHGCEVPESRNYLTWTCKHCGYGEVATRCADDE